MGVPRFRPRTFFNGLLGATPVERAGGARRDPEFFQAGSFTNDP